MVGTMSRGPRALRQAGKGLYANNIGARVCQARIDAGLTQKELGAIMSKPRSHSAISDIERGATQITVVLLLELANLLSVAPVWLIGDEWEE